MDSKNSHSYYPSFLKLLDLIISPKGDSVR